MVEGLRIMLYREGALMAALTALFPALAADGEEEAQAQADLPYDDGEQDE
jgi:hypothetical protein